MNRLYTSVLRFYLALLLIIDMFMYQNIRLDDENEVNPIDSATVSHIGPVECKILCGTDNKHYILEVCYRRIYIMYIYGDNKFFIGV